MERPRAELSLADAGRADHQDILGHHLFAQLLIELKPPPTIAQRYSNSTLRIGLADDKAVQFGDDFTR